MSPNTEEYEMLLDDLKDRVMEHQGETIYVVGTGGKVLTEYSNKKVLLRDHKRRTTCGAA